MKKLSIALLTAATALAMAPMAVATTIDFSCSDGNGVTTAAGNPASSAICSGGTPVSSNPTNLPLATWSQGAYTVSTSESVPGTGHGGGGGNWLFNPNQGNTPPALTALSSGTLPNGGGSGEEVVVSNGGEFFLESFDMKGGSSVTVTGRAANGAGVFQFTAAADSNWTTLADPYSTDLISFLQIDFTGGGVNYLDNIDVMTPEPTSLLLLGTGLLGFAFLAFRKSKSSRLTLHA